MSDSHYGTVFVLPPPRRTKCWNVVCILVAELVGTGVLGLPRTISVLGGALGGAVLLLFALLAYYAGILLWRLQHFHPGSVTYPEMARRAGGDAEGAWVTGFLYVAFFGNLAIYIVLMTDSLSAAIEDGPRCRTALSAVAVAILFPIAQLRTLHGVSFVALGSAVCIFLAVALIVGDALSDVFGGDGLPEEGRSAHFFGRSSSSPPSFLESFSAATTAVFAFGGQGLYLETMAEMRDPFDFRRALRISSVGIAVFYAATSAACYVRYGENIEGNILNGLPSGAVKRFAAALIFLHVAVSYALASQVVCRAAAVRIVPHLVDSGGREEIVAWLCISTAVLFSSWIIAEGVPFFHLLMGLVGAASTAPLTFGFPAWFWLRTMDDKLTTIDIPSASSSPHLGENGFLLHSEDNENVSNERGVNKLDDRTMHGRPVAERPLLYFMIAITVFLLVVGLVLNAIKLQEKWHQQGRPFACHV